MKPTSSDLISTMNCSIHFGFSSAFRPMHVLYGKIESSAVLGSTKKISGGCSFLVTIFVGAQGVTFPRTVSYLLSPSTVIAGALYKDFWRGTGVAVKVLLLSLLRRYSNPPPCIRKLTVLHNPKCFNQWYLYPEPPCVLFWWNCHQCHLANERVWFCLPV